MFGSVVLDVAVGLVFIYLLLSLICSALREAIEARLKSRAIHLQHGIVQLLQDRQQNDALVRRLYEHPLVFSLFRGEYRAPPATQKFTGLRWIPATIAGWWPGAKAGTPLPSYIPARSFALALLDLASDGRSGPGLTLDGIRAQVRSLGNADVERVILTAVDTARGDVDAAILSIQDWYDSAMDRVSGWYKRETQHILFWLGLALVVALNVDTIAIVRHLATSDTARSALVTRAEAVAKNEADAIRARVVAGPPAATADANVQAADAELKTLSNHLLALNLPVGWSRRTTDVDPLMRLAGWLITAFAISFGAPFWFDMLNKVMVIRSTVKPHEKSPEESSDDRQPSGPDALLKKLAALSAATAPASRGREADVDRS